MLLSGKVKQKVNIRVYMVRLTQSLLIMGEMKNTYSRLSVFFILAFLL